MGINVIKTATIGANNISSNILLKYSNTNTVTSVINPKYSDNSYNIF